MKRIVSFSLITLVFVSIIASCNNDSEDDGLETIPPRDRGEESIAADIEIREFLETHFYNYEDFETPPTDFDFKIVIDTISGDNADKTPLLSQVETKTATDLSEEDVNYSYYLLKARQGEGNAPTYVDSTLVTFEGKLINNNIFDGSVNPIWFDLIATIQGFQLGIIEFNGATGSTTNTDGTQTFENFGSGAVFMPSGMAYFNQPPSASIPLYAQLIFTFTLLEANEADHDNDGIPSINEDIDNNGSILDDDTDEDGIPNFADSDDDNDGILTRDEIEIDDDGNVTFPDSDGDGTPDYLDSDS